jgi:hypothetical protein
VRQRTSYYPTKEDHRVVRIYREDTSMINIVPVVFDSLEHWENREQLDAEHSLSLYVIMTLFLQTYIPIMGHNSFHNIEPKD